MSKVPSDGAILQRVFGLFAGQLSRPLLGAIVLFFFFPVTAHAQHLVALGAGAGTNGLQGQIGIRANDYLQVRAAYSNIAVGLDDLDLPSGDLRQQASITYAIEQGELLVDVHPFKNWFKLTLGGGYALGREASVYMIVLDTVYAGEDGSDPDNLGDFILYPEDLGFVDIQFLWNQWTPYVGFGFGRAVPNKRIGLSVDLGAYYLGSIRVEAEGLSH